MLSCRKKGWSARLDRGDHVRCGGPRVSEAIRLLVIDAPRLARRALAVTLNRRRRLAVVGDTGSGTEARTLARSLVPDVALVEPAIPDGGAELVADLSRQVPGCAVAVFIAEGGGAVAGPALQAGARACITKDCDVEDLARTIERVREGELVVAPALAESVAAELGRGAGPERSGVLTAREREVLTLVARGLTNLEIAASLCITEHTAKGHLAKILRKLGLDNRVQLATYALHHGLAALQADDLSMLGT